MLFYTRKDLCNFIKNRLLLDDVNFSEHYRMTLFDYYVTLENFAQMLKPEINMRYKYVDTEEFELIWSNGLFTIEVLPMKNTISMVIITSAIEDSYPDAKV